MKLTDTFDNKNKEHKIKFFIYLFIIYLFTYFIQIPDY